MNNFLLKTLLGILLFGIISYSQDTTKKKIDTVKYKPLKFILSDYKYSYINQANPDTVTRKRFLWYPMKNTEDIFNYLPGYYLKYMDVGQVNYFIHNQLDYNSTAVLRNGRPVNDFLSGEVDHNLFSRNEVDQFEISNGFGNFIYAYPNAVNVIQRQIFQNRPYTEISFIQDRYENLYFDGDFHQNLFRNLNFNFGITKHSYDGKYVNSDFDKWLGRFNLNFAASNKLNFFAYVNYATIQKGINFGIDPDTVNLGNKSEVFDPTLAVVVNSDYYEKKERFDVDAGAVFLAGKSSFTKLQLFVSNSFTEERDEENRPNPNGNFFQGNYHWIKYGAKLQQIFSFKLGRLIDIVSRSEGEYDRYLYQIGRIFSDTSHAVNGDIYRISYFSDLIARYKNVTLEGVLSGYTDDDFKSSIITPSIKAAYTFKLDSNNHVDVYASYQYDRRNAGGGVKLKIGQSSLSVAYYNYILERHVILQNLIFSTTENVRIDGVNLMTHLRFYKFDLNMNFSANFKLISGRIPKYFGNADLSFHDVAFRNKLEYKIGLTSRGWSEYSEIVRIPQNATLDFFIMGRIGRATFGITLENILNRVIYNTGVYPMTDRGGLANVVSRFNITWNFFD